LQKNNIKSKQHVSAIRGHHQVLSVPIRVSLYKSRDYTGYTEVYRTIYCGITQKKWYSYQRFFCSPVPSHNLQQPQGYNFGQINVPDATPALLYSLESGSTDMMIRLHTRIQCEPAAIAGG